MKLALARLGLSLVSILLVLLVGELLVRLPGWLDLDLDHYNRTTRTSADPRLIWELDPDHPLVNSDGLRDREYAVEKPPNTFRIVVVGDSVTYGYSVALEDTYVKKLEVLLNERDTGRNYEVINLGVGGYNTPQELVRYREKGRKYQPDLLIIGFVLNDAVHENTVLRALEFLRKQREAQWFRKSHLAGWVVDRVTTEDSDAASGFAASFQHRKTWRRLSRSLYGFARDAKEDGIPVVLVIFPLMLDLDHYQYRDMHAQVARDARRYGFVVLDLLDTYREQGAWKMQLMRSDIWHPGPGGHTVIAETLYAFLTTDPSGHGTGTAGPE